MRHFFELCPKTWQLLHLIMFMSEGSRVWINRMPVCSSREIGGVSVPNVSLTCSVGLPFLSLMRIAPRILYRLKSKVFLRESIVSLALMFNIA